MTKLAVVSTIAVLLAAGVAFAQTSAPSSGVANQLTSAQCQALWNKADAGKKGTLMPSEALPYLNDFKAIDTNNDGMISGAEFTAGCERGLVHDAATTGSSSGTSGSSSSKK